MKALISTLVVLLICTVSAGAAQYTIRPDGSGDYETIQDAIDATNNYDTIILTDGVFQGEGNRDLMLIAKSLTIRSQGVDPLECIIDCEGGEFLPHRGLSIMFDIHGGTEINGITITGGYDDEGGAIHCRSSVAPNIVNCVFSGNTATAFGGGIFCDDTAPEVQQCRFIDNIGETAGGGVFCQDNSDIVIEDCLFTGNSSPLGGAIHLSQSSNALIRGSTLHANSSTNYGAGITCSHSDPVVENTIISFSTLGYALSCLSDCEPVLNCSDLFGNQGGDWIGEIAVQLGEEGNIFADPRYCDQGAGDLELRSDSPCLPGNNGGCDLIGALGVGCDDGVSDYLVEADGSGPYPTIQSAIDAASPGETVRLGDGTFTGDGNRDLSNRGKEINIKSISGDPALCIIDCQGSYSEPHGGIVMNLSTGTSPELSGLTITGVYGLVPYPFRGVEIHGGSPMVEDCIFTHCISWSGGSALFVEDTDSVEIANCDFVGNIDASETGGGAVYAISAGVMRITDCDFSGNTTSEDGGAIHISNSDMVITGSSFVDNIADRYAGAAYVSSGLSTAVTDCYFTGNSDGALFANYGDLSVSGSTFQGHAGIQAVIMYIAGGATAELHNNLFAFNNMKAISIYMGGSYELEMSCCDIYGNTGGDWTGAIADELGLNGNISADPLFCDMDGGDLTLIANSPCLPLNSDGCGQIGYFGAGCDDGIDIYQVFADGSGDWPTIQAAINVAMDGDSILLADGTYTGEGNRDLQYWGKAIAVKSQSDNPEACIIDCQGSEAEPHRGFNFHQGELASSVLQGVTVTGGYPTLWQWGGGIQCLDPSAPTIINCMIVANQRHGVAILGQNTIHPTMIDCEISGNTASGVYTDVAGGTFIDCLIADNGGSGMENIDVIGTWIISGCTIRDNGMHGIDLYEGSSTIENCLIVNNTLDGVHYSDTMVERIYSCTISGNRKGVNNVNDYYGGTLEIDNSLIAFNREEAVRVVTWPGSEAELTCCDIFGNPAGDWTGLIADQLGTSGNISLDPLFCDAAAGDFSISDNSPCTSDHNPACGLIGALDIGCVASDTSYLVDWEGGGDFLTIAEGLAASSPGDTVLVTCGEYPEHDLTLPAGVSLLSETGLADCVTINGTDQDRILNRVGAGEPALLRGFTLTHGYQATSGGALLCQEAELIIETCAFTDNQVGNSGAAIYGSEAELVISETSFRDNSANHGGACNFNDSQLTLLDSSFENNSSVHFGGALRLNSSSGLVVDCVLANNTADGSGGAIFATDSSSVDLGQCTFYGNSAPAGSAMRVSIYTQATLDSSLVSFAPAGSAVACASGSAVDLICTDIFGNVDGDWTGWIADQYGENGNISEDPLFCDAEAGDFTVDLNSPCLPANNSCYTQMGAFGQGCDELTGLEGEQPLPARFYLAQNAPNPFNPTTVIRFGLPTDAQVELRIFDISGRSVRTLRGGELMPAGHHQIEWRGRDDTGHSLASGVYFYRLEMIGFSETRKMILLK